MLPVKPFRSGLNVLIIRTLLAIMPVLAIMSALTHWDRDKIAAIFKWIFLNENVRISIKISLKFVFKGPINNNPALA